MSKMVKRMMTMFLVIIMTVGTVTTASAASMDRFTDVQGHWGYDAIGWVVDNSYMSGMSSTQFNPNGTVTRAQITQILYNMAGKPDVTGWANPYKDVSEEAWYAEAAVWAYKKGVTGNSACTYFNPDECVPRELIALMFELYALRVDINNQKAKFELEDKYMSRFEDISAIGNDVFYKALNWAVQYGLIAGISETEVAPEAYTTRAMMAQLIKNYYDNRDEGSGNPPTSTDDPNNGYNKPSEGNDGDTPTTDGKPSKPSKPSGGNDGDTPTTDEKPSKPSKPSEGNDGDTPTTDGKPSKPSEGNDGDTPTTDGKPSKPSEGNDGDTPTTDEKPSKPSKPSEGNDGDTPATT